MFKFETDSYHKTEAKLLQAKSMATILLSNINYKKSGFDEPFIDESNTSNLAWTLIDLIDDSLNELSACQPTGSQSRNSCLGGHNHE